MAPGSSAAACGTGLAASGLLRRQCSTKSGCCKGAAGGGWHGNVPPPPLSPQWRRPARARRRGERQRARSGEGRSPAGSGANVQAVGRLGRGLSRELRQHGLLTWATDGRWATGVHIAAAAICGRAAMGSNVNVGAHVPVRQRPSRSASSPLQPCDLDSANWDGHHKAVAGAGADAFGREAEGAAWVNTR